MMDLANQNDSSSTILRLTNIVILGLLTITTICNDKTKQRGIKSWEYMP
jgi:BarA-like signal transduction histidine kinase